MGYDIAGKLDQHVHLKMEQTLSFYVSEITLQVHIPDENIGISCRRYTTIEKGEPKYYTWIFEKQPSGEIEKKVAPVIFPEEK